MKQVAPILEATVCIIEDHLLSINTVSETCYRSVVSSGVILLCFASFVFVLKVVVHVVLHYNG